MNELENKIEQLEKYIEVREQEIEELNNIIDKAIEHINKTIEFEKNCGFNYWEYDGGCSEYIEMVEKTLDILQGDNK